MERVNFFEAESYARRASEDMFFVVNVLSRRQDVREVRSFLADSDDIEAIRDWLGDAMGAIVGCADALGIRL